MGSPDTGRASQRGARGARSEAAAEPLGRPHPAGPRIETERLVLRLYAPQDFDGVHVMSAEPSMWAFTERGPMTPEESWARLLRHAGHWALRGYGVFAIEEKATGQMVGEAGFADFRRGFGADFDPFPEACWSIRPDRHGRGYATEAAAAALAWVEGKTGAKRTVCLIHAANAASHRVAAKLGFVSFRAVKYRGYRALLLQRDTGNGEQNALAGAGAGRRPKGAAPNGACGGRLP